MPVIVFLYYGYCRYQRYIIAKICCILHVRVMGACEDEVRTERKTVDITLVLEILYIECF